MLPAGAALGVAPEVTAMAIAWGDAWTNMIQPFWALPLLGIAGLGARDIMGYCLLCLVFSGVVIARRRALFPDLRPEHSGRRRCPECWTTPSRMQDTSAVQRSGHSR